MAFDLIVDDDTCDENESFGDEDDDLDMRFDDEFWPLDLLASVVVDMFMLLLLSFGNCIKLFDDMSHIVNVSKLYQKMMDATNGSKFN